MSHPKDPQEDGKPDFRPEAQVDEAHGAIKGEQLNGRNDPEINNARGAETGGGVGGGGPHRPGRQR
jgi:hypothetical protein